MNGGEEEVNGLTILALIHARIQSNYKVEMYSEITKVKKQLIVMYDNNVQLFFDAIKYVKLPPSDLWSAPAAPVPPPGEGRRAPSNVR